MPRPWRVTWEASEDLAFALSCLESCAVTLDELKAWVYRVLQDSDEFPLYLIDLVDAESRVELLSGWVDLVGFWPSGTPTRAESQAIIGIAYARWPTYESDFVGRRAATARLRESEEIQERFARFFPEVDLSVSTRPPGTGPASPGGR